MKYQARENRIVKILSIIAVLLGGILLAATLGGANDTDDRARDPDRPLDAQEIEYATFAGGCFWCVEEAFDEVEGVVETTSGYIGGQTENPTYEEVSAGGTGHAEAVQVAYNPSVVNYRELLRNFWYNIDPTDAGGQFCDRGDSYRSAIFYYDEEQQQLAEASKQGLAESNPEMSIVTPIVPAAEFYPAEEYHQNYYEKNPLRYKFYKWSCGRSQRLGELWGDAAGGVE